MTRMLKLFSKNDPGSYTYPEEIASMTMLGDDEELQWELIEDEGLKIMPPATKPCEHAFLFHSEINSLEWKD